MSGEIFGALAKVMSQVGAVTKARRNESQKYQFRSIDDVVAHVQQVMAEYGVICIPRVIERERELLDSKSGGKMASVRLLVEHTFFAKDGSSVVCTTLGEAMDSGDKASNKAMSAALKYCLTEALLIPTYEVDRDTEEQSPELAKPATPVPAPAATPRRMRIVDVPSDAQPKASPPAAASKVDELKRALEAAPDMTALALVAARIATCSEADKAALRSPYLARAAVLSPKAVHP